MYYPNQYPYIHPTGQAYGQYQHPYAVNPYGGYERGGIPDSFYDIRQQPVRGQATWTDGGDVTRCGIPWSHNQYRTAAVGTNTPYRCGQTLRIRNLSSQEQREIDVIVVDQVREYPETKVNLHRRAFEALGADPREGVIDVQITPISETAQPADPAQPVSPTQPADNGQQSNAWGQYFAGVIHTAYPGYRVTNIRLVERNEVSQDEIEETFELQLQSPQEQINVKGKLVYNPQLNKVKSVDFKED